MSKLDRYCPVCGSCVETRTKDNGKGTIVFSEHPDEFQKVLPGVVIHSVRRIGPEMRAYTKNGMGYRLDTGYPVAGEYLYVLVPQRITRNFGKRSPGPRDIVIKTRN
jgi:hypothetical protein